MNDKRHEAVKLAYEMLWEEMLWVPYIADDFTWSMYNEQEKNEYTVRRIVSIQNMATFWLVAEGMSARKLSSMLVFKLNEYIKLEDWDAIMKLAMLQ